MGMRESRSRHRRGWRERPAAKKLDDVILLARVMFSLLDQKVFIGSGHGRSAVSCRKLHRLGPASTAAANISQLTQTQLGFFCDTAPASRELHTNGDSGRSQTKRTVKESDLRRSSFASLSLHAAHTLFLSYQASLLGSCKRSCGGATRTRSANEQDATPVVRSGG